jgi:hypothetical protein
MVYTDISSDGLVVLVRRTGTTAGFLFGFGLLAVVMAGNASADDRQPGEEQPLLGTVESVTGLLSPVTGTVEPVLQPVTSVVHAGVVVLAPVAQPVAGVVEPVATAVVSPVTSTVTPILHSGTAVTERPPNMADPPTDPVPTTPSPTDTASAVTDKTEAMTPQQKARTLPRTGPARSWIASPAPVPEAWWSSEGGHASAAFVAPAQLAGSGGTGDTPGVRTGPFSAALGGGSVGGSGGSHGADTAISTPVYSLGHNNISGRSPPGSIAGHTWFGYDTRDHPS